MPLLALFKGVPLKTIPYVFLPVYLMLVVLAVFVVMAVKGEHSLYVLCVS
jgi:hypothetical protein